MKISTPRACGGTLKTVVLDSHVLYWWSQDAAMVSRTATRAITEADELLVADITWYELAWLATHGRIGASVPLHRWLSELAEGVRTIPVTPAIAAAAAGLPPTFPSDPADRLIYASAVELGARLVTRDERMRAHPAERPVTLW